MIAQSSYINPKVVAWDTLGSSFWKSTDPDGRPSDREIETYLADCQAGQKIAIVGGSTFYLIKAAIERGCQVSVLDFSKVMINDLVEDLSPLTCDTLYQDITVSLPKNVMNEFDFVLADRLLNRMDGLEATSALRNMARMVKLGGEVRLCIKMGLYRMDGPLIEEGRKTNTLHEFFDEETWTINFMHIKELLNKHFKPYGTVPKDVLLEWYTNRGMEKRYRQDDLNLMCGQVSDSQRIVELSKSEVFPDSYNCWFHVFTIRES